MGMFSWSRIQSAEALAKSRAPRFRPEWRSTIIGYFGLAPGMRVLEVGCGPGTLAPYLAHGIAPGGRVVGVDLDADFVSLARKAAETSDQRASVAYEVADAYALPFADGSFDAAVSYTGIGVLTDPERAVREMRRVVRPGGIVAVAEAVSGPFGFRFEGVDSLHDTTAYPEASRYWTLRRRLMAGVAAGRPADIGSSRWPPAAIPALLAATGLRSLVINAWGYVTMSDDGSPDNGETEEGVAMENEWEALATALKADPAHHQLLSQEEWNEWEKLSAVRRRWRAEHPAYAYEAGLSVVVRGINRNGSP